MIQLSSFNICELAGHITVHVHPVEECIKQLHSFLTLALYGSKWSVSGPGHPIQGATTHGCVGPKSWYGHLKEEKINLLPLPGIKPWITAQSLYYWGTQSLHITPDWSQSLTLHARDVSCLAGSFVLFIQSVRCVFLPETTSMINFWPSHVLLSCFWNNLTPNAWICMKIHSWNAPKICQYWLKRDKVKDSLHKELHTLVITLVPNIPLLLLSWNVPAVFCFVEISYLAMHETSKTSHCNAS